MKVRPKIRWMVLLSFFLVFSAFVTARDSEAAKGFVGTQTCIDCHQSWLDNNPETADVASGHVSFDYRPLSIQSSTEPPPWYSIPEGYVNSVHNITPLDLTKTDDVKCEGCHGTGIAHFGIGPIPTPIPGIKTCGGCHKETGVAFPLKDFLLTAHANPNNLPKKFFDQKRHGPGQAFTSALTPMAAPGLALFKQGTFGPVGTAVSKDERIEECSVCHNYALQLPQFRVKIAEGQFSKPAVSCGACHDSHIPAPSGIDPAIVTSTVVVNAVTGSSTPVSVSAVPGRQMSYRNLKPYKLGDNGAQNTINGIWTRGSLINRPQTVIIKGAVTVSTSSDGTCDLITLSSDVEGDVIGFVKNQVKEGDTLFVSGVASTTVNLPADAKLAGKPITLQATLDGDTFEIIQVIDERTVLVNAPVVATTNVTYVLANGKDTKNLSVDVSFCGLTLSFEVRNMFTNSEDLCGSCHTQGTYKYTKWGQKKDQTLVDLSPSHNLNIAGQYKTSGHADKRAPAWEEFFIFGGHNLNWPYDMSITGSGGVGSLRNKGKMTFALVATPDKTLAYLNTKGNTTLPSTTGSFNCLQCHNGLSAIDYLNDVQGTSAASVVWGDATVTCLTCHDPHQNEGTIEPNIRVPVKLSYNSRFVDATKNPRGGINKMMDGTDIPSGAGTGIICLFCHEGRESGLTVFLNITSNSVDPYTDPNKVIKGGNGISFQNPHYLESGAVLWSKNAWEYFFSGVPQSYSSGISAHQATNCAGCHMGEASPNGLEGGHTWRPRIETCQQCHNGATSFQDIQASADWDGNGKVESAFLEIGTVVDPVAGTGDYGLRGQLRQALQAKGIFYDPNANPYFFKSPTDSTSGNAFTAWTSNTLTAAFNLTFMYKAGNCVYIHNPFYAAQILQDSLKALGVTPTGVRPAGDRNATDYRTIVVNP